MTEEEEQQQEQEDENKRIRPQQQARGQKFVDSWKKLVKKRSFTLIYVVKLRC